MNATKSLLLSLGFCFFMQETQLRAVAGAGDADKDPAAILELGGAASVSLKDGGSSSGPNVAAEVTPIENWLELEGGVTTLFGHRSTEWDTDLLFKKPWTLSRKAEFMAGVGPEWIHTSENGVTTNQSPLKPR